MTDKVTGQCPQNHNLSEEKGEPKRYRTEVLPLTNLTPYRYAKPYAPSYYILKPLGRGRPSCAPCTGAGWESGQRTSCTRRRGPDTASCGDTGWAGGRRPVHSRRTTTSFPLRPPRSPSRRPEGPPPRRQEALR